MAVYAIIPARWGSTRLEGKPLLAETGKPLIQHVVEAVRQAKRVDRVIVATDDERIAQAVRAFGGEAMMTRGDHACGTDRISEAAAKLGLADEDVVVNVQGDEPEIPPECVDRLVELIENCDAPMATLATPLASKEADDPNRVKVVLAGDGTTLYFSRAKIPYDRDRAGGVEYLLHLGVYAYRVAFLKRFSSLTPTAAEQAEKLEQLRTLEHGYRIVADVVDYDGAGIDTAEDYAAFVARTRQA
jgi:3-deoxy-manno-octulosonate cytidylyltransferase (CMP-KDO synthetase)